MLNFAQENVQTWPSVHVYREAEGKHLMSILGPVMRFCFHTMLIVNQFQR